MKNNEMQNNEIDILIEFLMILKMLMKEIKRLQKKIKKLEG